MNLESDGIEEYSSLVAALVRCDVRLKPKKFELYMMHCESSPAKPSIKEAPKLELKALPPHLMCVFLGKGDIFLLIIALDLNMEKVECLEEVLKMFK